MKKQLFAKPIIAALFAFAAACQPKAPTPPSEPPMAPPQAEESENCTDVDECSEGAMIEQEKSATDSQGGTAATPAVVEEQKASQPAPAQAVEPVVEAPKSAVVEEAKETTSTPAPEVVEQK